MATITGTISRAKSWADAWVASWPSMGDADTGTSIEMVEANDKSVQFAGTFSTATVVLQGSNDGSNWVTLTDPQGNAISKTAAAIEQVLEHTRYIRPVTSGGGGASITVTVFMKGQKV